MWQDDFVEFMNAAWQLAGEMSDSGVELDKGADGELRLDSESKLRLCIDSPDRLDRVESAVQEFDRLYISGGKIGFQVKASPEKLISFIAAAAEDITTD